MNLNNQNIAITIKLTQEQVKFIDDLLIRHQIKCWDVRIELLDHIVSKVEVLMTNGQTFDQALMEVHKGFGNHNKRIWNTHTEQSVFVDGSGYRQFMKRRNFQIRREFYRRWWQESKVFFKSLRGWLIVLFYGLLAFYMIKNKENLTKAFEIALFLVFMFPLVMTYFYGFKNRIFMIKKRSIYLYQFLFLLISPLLVVINPIIIFLKPDKSNVLTEQQYLWITFTLLALWSVFVIIGLRVYKDALKRDYNLYQKLVNP